MSSVLEVATSVLTSVSGVHCACKEIVANKKVRNSLIFILLIFLKIGIISAVREILFWICNLSRSQASEKRTLFLQQ